MLRRLGIRGKVLAALTGPVLVLVLIAGLLTVQSAATARASGDGGEIATLLVPHADVVVALQAERTQATNLAAGRSGADVDTARAATDRAVLAMAEATRLLPDGILDGRIADLVKQATDMQATVDLVRSRVVGSDERAVDTAYTQLIGHVVEMPVLLSDRLTEPDLAAEFRAYGLAMTSSEELAHEAPVVRAVLLDPVGEIDNVRRLPALIALTDASLDSTRASLELLDIRGLRLSEQPGSLVTLRQSLSSALPEAIAGADAAQWAKADDMQHELGVIRADLLDVIEADAATLAADANRQAALTAGGAIAAVVLSIMLALLVARSIVRPMRSLTKAAVNVREELPKLIDQVAVPGQSPDLSLAEIPVTSNDEVGRLAAAFNEVNATTIHVAQEQAALRGSIAEMFVNVARRDQVLLNRQLSFIDALERSEEDPKVLADLFRLDHLATRMRRNAESLLVLAGIDTGRRLRDTLPLSDVIRTASSEIEHYERVLLDLPADPLMLGHTALPAAHLLAELIENATMFSDPGSPVHVSTGRDETHVLITVQDQGLGMTPEELEAAHTKIASASAGEVLGAQRLGMFVIGRIAARLGAQVTLSTGAHGTGTRALVRLPLALFVDIADVPIVAPVVPSATLGQHFPVPDPADVPAPAAVPVDLAQLTDGATGLGLPRRRVRGADTEAEAPSAAPAPALPAAEPHRPTFEDQPAPVAPAPTPVEDAPFVPVAFEQGADLGTGAPSSRPAHAEPHPVADPEPSTATGADGFTTIPAAPSADALAGAAATLGEDWSPLVSESAPLARRRRGQHAAPPTDEFAAVDRAAASADADAAAEAPHPWGDGSTRRSRKRRALLPYDAEAGASDERPGADAGGATPNPAFEPLGLGEPEDGGAADDGGADNGAGGGTGGGLPSRTPAAFAEAWPPAAGNAPVAPEVRATMFTGFRSRRAEVVAEQLEVRAPEQLAAPAVEQIDEPEAVEAPEPEAPAFVIPSLVDDDEEWPADQDVPFGVAVEYDETAGQPWSQGSTVAEPWETGYVEADQAEAPVDDTAWAASPVAQPSEAGVEDWAAAPEAGGQEWAPVADAAPADWAPAADAGPESWTQEAPAVPAAPVAPAVTSPVPPPPPVAAELPAAWAASAPTIRTPEAVSAPDFTALVTGSGPAETEPKPRARRGLFGRRTPKAPKVPKPAKAAKTPKGGIPAAPPALILPQAPAAVPVATPVPTAAPDRQSAWSSHGSHVQPEWDPQGGATPLEDPAADRSLSAAEELSFLSQGRAVEEAPAEPAFPVDALSAPAAPAVPSGTTWKPDPNAVDIATHASWPNPSLKREAPAPEPAEDEVADEPAHPAPAPSGFMMPIAPSWPVPSTDRVPATPAGLPSRSSQEGAATQPRSVPSQQGFATFVPSDDARDNDPIALRAGIAQQALAELSELSAYRPQAVGSAQPLVRRTPAAVPQDAPSEPRRPAAPRDANEVRSLLASFQSGTTRGRSAADSDEPVSASSDAAKQGTSR